MCKKNISFSLSFIFIWKHFANIICIQYNTRPLDLLIVPTKSTRPLLVVSGPLLTTQSHQFRLKLVTTSDQDEAKRKTEQNKIPLSVLTFWDALVVKNQGDRWFDNATWKLFGHIYRIGFINHPNYQAACQNRHKVHTLDQQVHSTCSISKIVNYQSIMFIWWWTWLSKSIWLKMKLISTTWSSTICVLQLNLFSITEPGNHLFLREKERDTIIFFYHLFKLIK